MLKKYFHFTNHSSLTDSGYTRQSADDLPYILLLNQVLGHHKPEYWDTTSYSNKRYQSFLVSKTGTEYEKVLKSFPEDLKEQVTSVTRIQNPYQYGRYLLRTEHLQVRNSDPVYQVAMYHPILKNDKENALEYNCDYRRYSAATYAQHNGSKRPIFYKNAQDAVNKFKSTRSSTMSLIVVQVLVTGSSLRYLDTSTPDVDTEYYPTYVVDLA